MYIKPSSARTESSSEDGNSHKTMSSPSVSSELVQQPCTGDGSVLRVAIMCILYTRYIIILIGDVYWVTAHLLNFMCCFQYDVEYCNVLKLQCTCTRNGKLQLSYRCCGPLCTRGQTICARDNAIICAERDVFYRVASVPRLRLKSCVTM